MVAQSPANPLPVPPPPATSVAPSAGSDLADPPLGTRPVAPATTPVALAGGRVAALEQPRSLIWTGLIALCVAVLGLLMVGRRRRQW